MTPPLGEGVLVAVVAAVGVIVGHWLQRRTSREDVALRGTQVALDVLRAQVKDLAERLRSSEDEIRVLHSERAAERARSWAAVEYCRALRGWGEDLLELVPSGVATPTVPPVPSELDLDL